MGLGRHAEHVSLQDVVSLAKIALVIDVLYLWNLAWSKISLLLLYYRVFRFGYVKSAAYAIGALVVLLAVVSTFLTGFLCVPLSKVWDDSLPGHCLDQQNLRIFNSVSTIVTDIIILCLPMPQIWKLQLQRAQKTGLTCLFALGFLWVHFQSPIAHFKPFHSLTPFLVRQCRICRGIPHKCFHSVSDKQLLLKPCPARASWGRRWK